MSFNDFLSYCLNSIFLFLIEKIVKITIQTSISTCQSQVFQSDCFICQMRKTKPFIKTLCSDNHKKASQRENNPFQKIKNHQNVWNIQITNCLWLNRENLIKKMQFAVFFYLKKLLCVVFSANTMKFVLLQLNANIYSSAKLN